MTASSPAPLTVCIPDAVLGKLIAPEVRVLVWDGVGPAPAGIKHVTYLVPPHRVEPIATAELARMTGLSAIQLFSAGTEHWHQAVPGGVTLCNGGALFASSTAELALGGILHLLHDIPSLMAQQRERVWRRRSRRDLAAATVLIIGAGAIGERLRAALELFGADVTSVGRSMREGVVPIEQVGDLLPVSDVVVIAVPLTAGTHHLVDREFLGAMPDGGILVNVSRGQVVDQSALVAELESRRLRAFLDVVDPEPLPADYRLWDAPGLLLTPHIGGEPQGWLGRAAELVAEQVSRLARGNMLLNIVKPATSATELGYLSTTVTQRK